MPTSKSRPYSTIEGLAHEAPREYLHRCHPSDLVKAVLSLRIENKGLCGLPIPPRISSQGKDHSPSSSVSRKQLSENQKGEFPRPIRGIDLANKRVRDLELELEEVKTRAKEAEEKANQELREERAKVEEAEKQRRRSLKELAAATRTEGTLYDDNHFREEVTSLRYLIKNWVGNHSWRAVDERDRSPNLKPYRFLKPICANYDEYIYIESELRTFVHSYIWGVLGRQVFGRNLWAESGVNSGGPDGQSTSSNSFSAWADHIANTIDDPMQSDLYHEWRVATAHLVATTSSATTDRAVKKETQDLVSDVRIVLKQISKDGIDVPGLEDLFHKAVKLDAVIQQQRPRYMFYPLFGKDLAFDEITMTITNTELGPEVQAQPIVKLVVEPGLRKYGNSAGRNYDCGISLLTTTVEVE